MMRSSASWTGGEYGASRGAMRAAVMASILLEPVLSFQ
jgi:hypothetical protein